MRGARAEPAASFWRGPLVVALLAWSGTLATLDAAGSYPQLAAGPGITLDEVFNVEMGVYQWRALRDHGLSLWESPLRERIFGDPRVYNPDHPPLGRIWLGAWHDLTFALFRPRDPAGFGVTACARAGSAAAFAWTVFLVGLFAGRWYGRLAGWYAAAAYAVMPRIFAHAHLAALESSLNLTFAATLLYLGDRWGTLSPRAHGRLVRTAVIGGLLFGLALLTKLQAILIPIPVTLWALWRFRLRALLPLAVFVMVGIGLFLLGWPWLWIDPERHVSEYLGRGVERATVYCFYLGTRFADVDVPCHYPFVLFGVTVPVGLHGLALAGCLRSAGTAASDEQVVGVAAGRPRSVLLTLSVASVLAFFAVPGLANYDGERLFLTVFPLWGVLAGSGAHWLMERLAQRTSRRVAASLVACFVLLQGYGVFAMHPCQLSYYNLLVGGLRGADRLGFERTYWGDSITRPLLEQLVAEAPRGATVDVAPVLTSAALQLEDLRQQSPQLRVHEVRLRAYDDPHRRHVRYVLVFRRRADPWHSLEPAPQRSRLLAETRRQGVQLAALYELE